jgi:hypothetical protein
MHTDPIALPRRCDRCLGPLMERRVSRFTDETICGECHAKEMAALEELRLSGPSCGFASRRHRQAAGR